MKVRLAMLALVSACAPATVALLPSWTPSALAPVDGSPTTARHLLGLSQAAVVLADATGAVAVVRYDRGGTTQEKLLPLTAAIRIAKDGQEERAQRATAAVAQGWRVVLGVPDALARGWPCDAPQRGDLVVSADHDMAVVVDPVAKNYVTLPDDPAVPSSIATWDYVEAFCLARPDISSFGGVR